MSVSDKVSWGSLENWSARLFLAAGVLVSIQAVSDGLGLATDIEPPDALAFAIFLGFILSYLGLLGLYPRLVDRTPQLARAGLVLVLLPVLALILLMGAILASSGPPFSEETGRALFMGIFVGFALGITALGVASFRTQIPSRAVGLFLLVWAAGWYILLGTSLIYGFPISEWVTFVTDAIMAVSLLAIGYLHHTGITPLKPAGPTDTTT